MAAVCQELNRHLRGTCPVKIISQVLFLTLHVESTILHGVRFPGSALDNYMVSVPTRGRAVLRGEEETCPARGLAHPPGTNMVTCSALHIRLGWSKWSS